jgi:hypothetical protein
MLQVRLVCFSGTPNVPHFRAGFQQGCQGSLGLNPSILQDDDVIGALHGRQPMGDNQLDVLLEQLPNRLIDAALGSWIKMRRGFIKNTLVTKQFRDQRKTRTVTGQLARP